MSRRSRFRQLVRYAAVSLIATTVSLTVLGALVSSTEMPAGWANVVATAAGTVPSFELNRRWVWGRRDERSLLTQVVPFCVLSFAGLGVSTLAVSVAAAWAASSGLAPLARTLSVELANIGAFGLLWIAQFLILDRLLFHHRAGSTPMPNPLRAPA